MYHATYIGPVAALYGKGALIYSASELGYPPNPNAVYAQFDSVPEYSLGWHEFPKEFFTPEVRENAAVTGCAIPRGIKPPERVENLTREQLCDAIEALNHLQLVNHHDYWVRHSQNDGWAWDED